jgi:hypothetical protein
VLKPGGIVAMAIPDRRYCFDYFRGHSITGDFIAAFFEGRERPTAAQVFSQASLDARWRSDGRELHAFSPHEDPSHIVPTGSLEWAFQQWKTIRSAPDNFYTDVHCWTFTPSSLELILRDLQFLGLLRLRVENICGPSGCEFYVRLSNQPAQTEPVPPAELNAHRTRLLHQIYSEAAASAVAELEIKGAQREAAMTALEARAHELEVDLARREREVNALRSSTSWRITAPARALARLLLGQA